MLEVLAALGESRDEPRHGYDLMKVTGLSSGTLYPLLMRMRERGLVEAEWAEPDQPGRPPRQTYRLTLAGRHLVRETLLADPALVPARRPV